MSNFEVNKVKSFVPKETNFVYIPLSIGEKLESNIHEDFKTLSRFKYDYSSFRNFPNYNIFYNYKDIIESINNIYDQHGDVIVITIQTLNIGDEITSVYPKVVFSFANCRILERCLNLQSFI